MIRELAQKLAALVVASERDDSCSEETYVYGFEIILSKAITYTLMLLAGLLLGLFWEMLIYIAFLMLLRGHTGGYHFRTNISCITFSVSSGVVTILLSKALAHFLIILPAPVMFSVCYIVKYAPVNHPNLNITISEAKKCMRFAKLYLGIELLAMMVLHMLRVAPSLLISGYLGIIMVAISMAFAKIKKQEVSYHDENEQDRQRKNGELGGTGRA